MFSSTSARSVGTESSNSNGTDLNRSSSSSHKMQKKRTASKKLVAGGGLSTRSNDSSDGTTVEGRGGGMVKEKSFFGRLKQGRRPSMTNTTVEDSPVMHTESEPRRVSMGRRPSLGSAFTTRRRSERRPSMDTASIACFHETQALAQTSEEQQDQSSSRSRFEQDLSSFRNSITSHTSSSTRRRRPSTAHSDDGCSLIHPTVYAVPSPAPPKPHPVISALLQALEKEHMMDVSFLAQDGTKVPASRFVMACRVQSLEPILFPKQSDGADPPKEISLGNYSAVALKGLVEYCFCGEAVKSLSDETPGSMRGMVELAQLASSLNFRVLQDETYQWARRVMNRNPHLVSAAYDAATSPAVKEIQDYALVIIQESPKDTLLTSGGIQHLSADRLLELLSDDHELEEISELTVFHIISTWYNCRGQTDEAFRVARQCTKKALKLQCMETHDLETIVRPSGLCEDEDIFAAIQERATNHASMLLLDDDNEDAERVLVRGAGVDRVNGVYIRQPDQDGQAMYSKVIGDDSIGLFQWENTWGIGPSFDLSNMFYEVQSTSEIPPLDGWEVSLQGENPPPACQWMAAATTTTSMQPLNDESEGGENITERQLPACYRSEEELYGN